MHPRSAAFVNNIGSAAGIHADFGSGLYDGGPIGIPYTTVPGTQARVPVAFQYDGESDRGPYPIPETYGAIVADNGSPWFISGVRDSRWDNDALHQLGSIKGSDWQAVDESSLQVSANSGQARIP